MIPTGKVTTYGAIAEYLGVRSGARAVGWALNKTLTHNVGEDLPCHRVVNRLGSGKIHFSGSIMEEGCDRRGYNFSLLIRLILNGTSGTPARIWIS